jgi:hypothetical protein
MVVWAVAKRVCWAGVSEQQNWPWAESLHQLTGETTPQSSAVSYDIVGFIRES